MTRRNAQGNNPATLEFKITDAKLYVPVVSLSKKKKKRYKTFGTTKIRI